MQSAGGKLLVLGGGGLLGHKVFQILGSRFEDVWCSLRGARDGPPWRDLPLFRGDRVLDRLDVSKPDGLESALRASRPAVVVNCIGAIKQRPEAQDAITSITMNALLPHRIAAVVREWGARVIHFSTDCVFSGIRGCYTETDQPDATDLYGRTKALGEICYPHAVTLRTSFIGRELRNHESLLEWFLAQNHGKVRGFRRVWWSGVTSNHLAELVADIIERHRALSGLYQVSSGRISKYELLLKLRDGLRLDIEVEPDDSVESDRSLDGSRFAEAVGYRSPSWETLIAQLDADPTPYEAWADEHGVSR